MLGILLFGQALLVARYDLNKKKIPLPAAIEFDCLFNLKYGKIENQLA